MDTALITEPTTLFAFLAAILGGVFWLSTIERFKKFFELMPPVIWAYFLPMFATTFGVTPESSVVYDWMSRYLLPFSLFLLMITVDLPAILKLGRIALIMMVTGTVGIVIGGPIALMVFGSMLPEEAWKGFAALSGSWIGGTANMVAMKESVGTPDAMLGPIIVVDTVVGYGWMGILIFLSAVQKKFDKWVKADTTVIEETNQRLIEMDSTRQPSSIADLAGIIGLTFAATVIALNIAGSLPKLGDPTIISTTTWTVLIVVTIGLLLSFTPMRKMEKVGASRIGFLALYLLLTSIGAKANLLAVLEAPVFLAAGALWIAIHVGLLLIVAKLAQSAADTLTPRQFWLTIAKRGGFIARKNDGPPGWMTIWRGWYDIMMMVHGVELLGVSPQPKSCG